MKGLGQQVLSMGVTRQTEQAAGAFIQAVDGMIGKIVRKAQFGGDGIPKGDPVRMASRQRRHGCGLIADNEIVIHVNNEGGSERLCGRDVFQKERNRVPFVHSMARMNALAVYENAILHFETPEGVGPQVKSGPDKGTDRPVVCLGRHRTAKYAHKDLPSLI